jgi:LPS sulfotransferase NodH
MRPSASASSVDEVAFEEDLSTVFFDQPLDARFPPAAHTERKLIVLHTGRCGTTLLHHHFAAAGFCPPFEIFNPQALQASRPVAARGRRRAGLADHVLKYRRQMLGAALNDPSCLVSYSLTPWQLSWMLRNARALVNWLFADAGVLLITRRNIFRQAISYTSAELSQL